MFEAYFDESGTHDDSPCLVVAGYLFERDKCRLLTEEWGKMLADYGLPYFHMTDCAVDPGFGHFANMPKKSRIDVATRAIELIKLYHALGAAISIDMAFADRLPKLNLYESPYTFACWHALMAVRRWADVTKYEGEVAYCFESGHENGPEARRIMDEIFRNPELRKDYRYGGALSFGDKDKVLPLQCADILAWQAYRHIERVREKKPMRLDLVSLSEREHYINHYDEKKIAQLSTNMQIANYKNKWVSYTGPT